MIHIKVFDNFKEKLYIDCIERNFIDANMVDMDENIHDAISKVTNKLKVRVVHKKEYLNIYGSDFDRSKLIIFMSDDEWFYAQLDKNISSSKYYKCDTVEGVLQLLKDIFEK